ncbi:MAG: hypothetical protein M1409_10710 [Actinobacteria bacterium]|nr:hypothetical protein [Actinomycetota bacterium]
MLYFKNITAIIVAAQFIIISSVVNFLSFSQILYEASAANISFVILTFLLIFIFQFTIIFYLHSNLNDLKTANTGFENNLFYFGIEEWLGEK